MVGSVLFAPAPPRVESHLASPTVRRSAGVVYARSEEELPEGSISHPHFGS